MTKLDVSVILLAAGKSSRFWPLNYHHKSLIKILGKPILGHVLDELVRLNIGEIIIVHRGVDSEIVRKLIGEYNSVEIKSVIQDEPRGMWNAIILGSSKANYDKLLVMNAHHLDMSEHIERMAKIDEDIVLTVCKTKNPEKYGIVKLRGEYVIDVVEKPPAEVAPSNLRIVGVYLFKRSLIDKLEEFAENSDRVDEYILEDFLSYYAKKFGIRYVKLEKEPLSLKYPWDVFNYMNFLFDKKIAKRMISQNASISKWAVIEGKVIVEEGAKISRHTSVIGPAYIGKDVFVGDGSIVRGSDLEESVVIGAHMEVARSLLQRGVKTHSGYIGDSIIGEGSRTGAGFITANVRLDGKEIRVKISGKKVGTGRRKLGAIIGKNVKIGIHVGTMPGVLIGNNAIIGPGKMIYENVKDEEKLL